MKRFKFLNLFFVLFLIIAFGGVMFAQDMWIVKISDLGDINKTIYESDFVKSLENRALFQAFFPHPQAGFREPITKKVFSFKEKIQEKLEDPEIKNTLLEEFIGIALFEIRAESLGLYDNNKLEQKLDRFQKLMEFETSNKLFLVKHLLDKAKPSDESIDQIWNQLNKQYGDRIPKDKIEELAVAYAKEQKAIALLQKTVNKKTGEKIIIYGEDDPFDISIDGKKPYDSDEIEKVYKAYVDYTAYVIQGGNMKDSKIEEIYSSKEEQRKFAATYLNYQLIKETAKEKGVYDEEQVQDFAKRFTSHFKSVYITNRYAKKVILPKVEELITEEMIESTIAQLKDDPRYTQFLKDKSDEYIYRYVKNMLYQQKMMQLKQEELQKIRGMYKIIENDEYFGSE
ncbi:MAG: hypothetical protein ACOCV8_00015 [Spirochaetota bacterium]